MKSQRAPRSAPLPAGVELDLVQTVATLPEPHGLDAVAERVMSLLGLGRRHPVLVGPSEVGKTAIVHAIARKISRGERPRGAAAIWQVSLRTLDAQSTKDDGVGPRLARIIREAAASPLRPIVYVRDLRMLRVFDAQHQLVESLSHVAVNFLGEAWAQYHAWLADDAELAAVTHVVRVDEPGPDAVRAMLRAQAARLLALQNITIDEAAMERAMRHAQRLMPQRRFPGKALALIDESAREAMAAPGRHVTAAAVTARACESLRVPRFLVDPDAEMDVAALRSELRESVVGQDEAIDAVVQSLALYKSGLGDGNRPIGVLMLAGPAGVGKTLLAQKVAETVFGSPGRLVRISLSEHSEDYKVDQLFGQRNAQSIDARRGLLARQLSGKPFTVLLLDEIEKAHGLAYKHLLRPLDEGTYVNGNDEEISLRNTLVILTSSVGAELYRDTGLGFARADAPSARAESVRKKVRDMLPWDLLDRVDRVCVCAPLAEEQLRELTRREIDAAVARAGGRWAGVRLDVDESVVSMVVAAALGTSGHAAGARAVRRAVEQAVIAPLALHLIAHQAPAAGEMRVAMLNGGVVPVGVPSVSAASDVEVRRTRGEIRVGAPSRARTAVGQAAVASTASVDAPKSERPGSRRTSRVPRS